MNITLPPELLQTAKMTEAELLQEIAIMLFNQKRIYLEQAAQLIQMEVDDFYQLLVDRNILPPNPDPDNEPTQLVLAHLRISLQQAKEDKVHPLSELWDGIDE